MGELRVEGPTRNATLVMVDGDHIGNVIEHTGKYYEEDLLLAVRSRGRKGAYVDVGAHCGNHTAFFALECPSTEVVAIEPGPMAWDCLQKTIDANDIRDKVLSVRCAVHDELRSVDWACAAPENLGMGYVTEGKQLNAFTLDEILKDAANVAVIKIDCEGSELEVLRSAVETIKKHRPILVVETATDEERAEVRRFLQPLGYEHGDRYCATPTYIWEPRMTDKKKLAVVCDGGDTFLRPILEQLEDDWEIRRYEGRSFVELAQWADVVWFEWCERTLVNATTMDLKDIEAKCVCRLHSYEVFGDLPDKVNWEKTAGLVFVADHVKDYFLQKFALYGRYMPPVHVVHNGVDIQKFKPRPSMAKKDLGGKRVASVGYINHKKNPGLLMQCFKAIHDHDPAYTFHVAGTFQDPRMEEYVMSFVDRHELPVSFDGWVEDMPAWYADKQFVISTSFWESFHYSIAEGMACGLVPLIHGWTGARDLYPTEYVYETPEGCVAIIKKWERTKGAQKRKKLDALRKHVTSRYTLTRQVKEIRKVLKEAFTAVPAMLDVHQEDKAPTHGLGITMTMIARNEELGVGRAIDSCKAFCEKQLVLVDDKTEDRTFDVAADHGATVEPYTFTDDFAAARNLAQSMAKTPWVFVLDGHEYLKGDLAGLARFMRMHPDVDGYELEVVLEDGDPHKDVRLYRKDKCRWENPIHNTHEVQGKVLYFDGVKVVHDRDHGQSPASRFQRSVQRDKLVTKVLSKKVRENPKDTRSIFYLAQQHRDAGRWDLALHWYRLYTLTDSPNVWPEELFQAHVQAARAAMAISLHEEALEHGAEAAKLMPARAEGWCVQGDAHYATQDFAKALEFYQKAESCEIPKDARLWVDKAIHKDGWKVLDVISMCMYHLGQHGQGIEVIKRILELPALPEDQRGRIAKNAEFHRKKSFGS